MSSESFAQRSSSRRVQVEDVARVGLAARRAAQQQRHGAVGLGLLGQVVEDDQDVLAVVHPVLADGRAGVGREVLEARAGRRPGPRRSWCTPARRPPPGRRAPRRWSSPSGRSRRRCSGPACAGSPDSQFCFWLMIVSMAIVVLPVARSPMISWRWPRPIGVIASIALMPVASGSLHRLALHRRPAPGAPARGALGLDLAETVDRGAERVDDAAEEAVAHRAPRGSRPCDGPSGPPRCPSKSPRTTTPISRMSRFRAMPSVPSSNSSSSLAIADGRPVDAGDAVAGLGDACRPPRGWPSRACSPTTNSLQRVADLLRTDRELRHCRPCSPASLL